MSPDNGVQQYHLGPLAICNDTAIPDSWCCSSGPCLSGVSWCRRVGRPESSPDVVGCQVSVCRPKTVWRVSNTFLPGSYPDSDPVVIRV